MEPLGRKEPLDSPHYIYEVKWDGVRILALVEQHHLLLKNRRGNLRTAQYPELHNLNDLVSAKSAILDGEVVALAGGKPSFARVLRRDLCRRKEAVSALWREIPCTYCLFDLLFLEGADLTGAPIEKRQQLLGEIVKWTPPLYLNENFADGAALYREVKEAGLEGVVAKKRGSLYRCGEKTTDWLKIKPRRRQLCVVGGLSMPQGQVSALLLGAYLAGELIYIGKAGSGLKEGDLLLLGDLARRAGVSRPPFSNPPRGGDFFWLKPGLTVVVEFAEMTGALRLRAPVVAGFSERAPAEAVL